MKRGLVALAVWLGAGAVAAVDVNSANQADLESVEGIGPSLSTRILEARQRGRFTGWEDLARRVKGVGNGRRLARAGLTIDDAASAPRFGANEPAADASASAAAAAASPARR
ncbi:MAG: helix-hairpin-helix domain-containing protein [Caldimonas sp.]